jgi:hypothetical protein
MRFRRILPKTAVCVLQCGIKRIKKVLITPDFNSPTYGDRQDVAQKERCPWCESEITRDKFEKIESRIRDEERERLGKHEAELKKRFEDEKKRELEAQKHSIETQQRLEATRRLPRSNLNCKKAPRRFRNLKIKTLRS